jgi:hypothetical protein
MTKANTTTTTTAKFSGIHKGFVYKDFVGGELLTVEKVTGNSIVFDNGLEVTNLDAFELVEKDYDKIALSLKKFETKDGELFMDGVRVETGTLYIEEVLYTTAPYVGLKVRSLEKGKYDLFIYNFLKDHFEKTNFVFDKVLENEEKIENLRVLRLYFEDELVVPAKEVDEEDLNEAVRHLADEDKYVFSYKGEFLVILLNGQVIKDLILNPSKKSELVVFDENLILVQQSDVVKDILYQDGKSIYTSIDSDKTTVTEVIITPEFDGFDGEDLIDVRLSKEDVVLRKEDVVENISITNSNNNSLLIVTKNGFIYSNNGYHPRHAEGKVAKEAVKDYPYFIRLEAGTQRNIFTLANDKRETVKVEVVKTQDRGYTTNII